LLLEARYRQLALIQRSCVNINVRSIRRVSDFFTIRVTNFAILRHFFTELYTLMLLLSVGQSIAQVMFRQFNLKKKVNVNFLGQVYITFINSNVV
jgi:hypothetical protein